MFEARFKPIGDGYYPKWHPQDDRRGGAFKIYQVEIWHEGTRFADTDCYIKQLSSHNTRRQDDYIRAVSPWAVIEHDDPLTEALVTGKARVILDALRAFVPTPQEAAA